MEQNYINSFLDSFGGEEELPLEENIQDPFDQYHKHEMTLNYFSRSLNENEEDELKPKNIPNLTQFNDFISYENDFPDRKQLEPIITGNTITKGKNETPNQIYPKNKGTTDTSNKSNSISNTSFEAKTKNKKNTLLGRKRKEEKGKGEHSKFKDDNKMRRIKSYFLRFILEKTNSSLSPGHKKFLKIKPEVNENLNKRYNDELMKTKIKNIYTQNPINGRYSKKGISKYYNADLVKEIYEKNEEKNAMKILDSTYIQFFDVFRKYHIDRFKNDILKKETKNGEEEKEAEDYVDQLVKLIFNYEEWFGKKTPRSHKKE